MARGKYATRSRRHQEREAKARERGLRETLQEEQARLAAAEARLEEVAALTIEVLNLRAEIEARGATEAQAIRGEISDTLDEILELEEIRRRERRVRDRRFPSLAKSNVASADYLESMLAATGEDATVLLGIHEGATRLGEDAVRRIQRARGVRR